MAATPVSALIAEAQRLLDQSVLMDQQAAGNKGASARLAAERAKVLAFMAVAQSVADMVAHAAAVDAGSDPDAERLLTAVAAVQAAVTPPLIFTTPTPAPPASTPPGATAPAAVPPTAPTGVLLTTYAAAWADGYRAAHPTSWAAGRTSTWPTAHAAGYTAGHAAGYATGRGDAAAALLHVLTAALAP